MSAPIGPYSPWVRAGSWIIVSGQIGLVAGELAEGVAAQTAAALGHLETRLAEAGAEISDVAKTTIFLTDMDDFAVVNEVYASFFAPHRPARSTVGVAALPLGAVVEIEAWAWAPQPPE